MPLLYSDKVFSNPIEEILLDDAHVITKYHNIVTIYDKDLNFIRDKYFYARINDIKLSKKQLILLMDDKLVQCDLKFKTLALRTLRDSFTNLFSYSDFCVLRNSYKIKIFKLNSEKIKEEMILNERMELIPSNIPVIAVLKDRVLSLINIDNNPTTINQYNVLDDVDTFKCVGKFVIVVYRQLIQVIHKSSIFVLKFNRHILESDSQCQYKLDDSAKGVVDEVMVEEERMLGETSPEKDIEFRKVLLEENKINFSRSKIFECKNEIFLINGDGVLFKLLVKEEIGRIFDASLEFVSQATIPHSVCGNDFGYAIASVKSTSLIKIGENMLSIKNLGIATGISKKKGNFVISTEKYVFSYFDQLRIECILSDFSPGTDLLQGEDGRILMRVGKQAFLLDQTTLQLGEEGEDIPNQCMMGDVDGIYRVSFDGKIRFFVEGTEVSLTGLCCMNHTEELCLKVYNKIAYLFVRTNKILRLYAIDQNNHIEKQFINECIVFPESSEKTFYKGNDFVYIKNRKSYFALHQTKVFLVQSERNYDAVLQQNEFLFTLQNQIISKHKFHALKSKNLNQNSCISKPIKLCNNEEIEIDNSLDFESNNDNQQNNDNKENLKKFIYTTYEKNLQIRKTQISSLGLIASITVPENYKFVPFVPLVYRTIENAQTITERIFPYEKDDRTAVLGQTFRHTIALFNNKYQFINSLPIDRNEYVTDLKIFLDKFVIVGTAKVDSEEKVSQGKMRFYQIVSVVAEKATPHKNLKLKLLCSEPTKYAVNKIEIFYKEIEDRKDYALDEILVCAGIGTRLMVYEVNYDKFTAVGRQEISVSTTQLHIIKNLIVVGDIFQGISFYFLRPENPLKLTLLGQTFSIQNLQGVFSLFRDSENSNSLLLFSVTKSGEISGFSYSPLHAETLGGTKLLMKYLINTAVESYPVVFSCFHENLISLNNVFISLKEIYTVDSFHSLYESILNNVIDSCGLHPDDFLVSSAAITKGVENVYHKRVLLEYLNMEPNQQENVQKETEKSNDEILNEIFDLIY